MTTTPCFPSREGLPMTLDLAIRGGTVATAADTMRCDVGIRDGRIVALGEDVGPAARTIDAAGILVLKGHHLDQFQGEGISMADGFRSGTTSAAAGGNTTVIPFALQRRGESLRAAVEAYHAGAGNRPPRRSSRPAWRRACSRSAARRPLFRRSRGDPPSSVRRRWSAPTEVRARRPTTKRASALNQTDGSSSVWP